MNIGVKRAHILDHSTIRDFAFKCHMYRAFVYVGPIFHRMIMSTHVKADNLEWQSTFGQCVHTYLLLESVIYIASLFICYLIPY